jgi:hypothetical protein
VESGVLTTTAGVGNCSNDSSSSSSSNVNISLNVCSPRPHSGVCAAWSAAEGH